MNKQMNTEKWKYLQQRFETSVIPGVSPASTGPTSVGATGPAGPPGPTPIGEQYSDYLFWNINGATWSVGSTSVHMGSGAGLSNQATCAVAVGVDAGKVNQACDAVAIGTSAACQNQSIGAVAVGMQAGNHDQNQHAVALGSHAGFTGQGRCSIALGYKAGYQNQKEKSIVLNAWDTALNTPHSGALYVRPVRDAAGEVPPGSLFYNNETGEIVYASTSAAPNTVKSVTKSVPVLFADASPSSVPRFLVNSTATPVPLSTTQRVVIQVNIQLVLTCSVDTTVAFTVGRGTTATPSSAYVNLANSLEFITVPLSTAESAESADALQTSISQVTSVGTGDRVLSSSFVVCDAPGAATWFYAIHATTSQAATLTVRNTHMVMTVVNV